MRRKRRETLLIRRREWGWWWRLQLRQLDSDEQDALLRQPAAATMEASKGSSQKFMADYILSVRASCAELAHHELDMAIMSQLLACMNTQPAIGPSYHHSLKDRQKSFTSYFRQDQPICEKMFFLHEIGRTRLKNLMKSVQTECPSGECTRQLHRRTTR